MFNDYCLFISKSPMIYCEVRQMTSLLLHMILCLTVVLSNQEHKEFYESLFSLALTPRSLQHLARCRLRSFLEGRVLKVVPKLDLPTFIKNYLLLEYRGYVH